jgi:hypothetical protein
MAFGDGDIHIEGCRLPWGYTSFVMQYDFSEKIQISVCFSCRPDFITLFMEENGLYKALAHSY